MTDSAEKKTVWFVQDGRMMSSWIIGSVTFHVEVEEDATSSYSTPSVEIAAAVIGGADPEGHNACSDREIQQLHGLGEMCKRPGTWYRLSGMRVQHADDCYPSKAEAAQAYAEFLMQ